MEPQRLNGKVWFNQYVSNLAPEDQSEVFYHNSDHVYQFGDSKCIQALEGVNIPAYMGNIRIMLNTDIVNSDIPYLLSKSAKKKANMKLNFEHDTLTVSSKEISLLQAWIGKVCDRTRTRPHTPY